MFFKRCMKLFKVHYLLLLVGFLVLFSCNNDDGELSSEEDSVLFYEVSGCEGYDYLYHANETNLLMKRGEELNLDYIIFNFNGEDEYLIDYDSFNRPQYIKMGDCWVHLCNYEGNSVDALVFKDNEYVTSLENVYTEVDWNYSRLNTVQSRNMDAALESLKEDAAHLMMGVALGFKVFAPVTKMLVTKGIYYTPVEMIWDYVDTAIDLIEDFGDKSLKPGKLAYKVCDYYNLSVELKNSKSPLKHFLDALASKLVDFSIDDFYNKQKDNMNKMYSSRFVGPWDYQVNNGSPFEIVFLKNGTFIDYWDFYTYGYYNYDWLADQLVLTYLYINNDKGKVEVSAPLTCFDIVFRSNEIQYSLPSGGVVRMVKKNKSQYYTGDYNSDPSIPKL